MRICPEITAAETGPGIRDGRWSPEFNRSALLGRPAVAPRTYRLLEHYGVVLRMRFLTGSPGTYTFGVP